MSILQKPHQLPNSIFLEKCRKQSDFALEKCKCYHIICRHQYTHATNSILFVICPFKIGFHPSENHLYFIPVFIYTYIKVKLTEGEKRWLRQSRTEPYLPIFSFGCKRIRNPNSKAKQDSPLIKTQKPTRKSVNPSLILQLESEK